MADLVDVDFRGRVARAVRVQRQDELVGALRRLELGGDRPTLVLVGGAAGMPEETHGRLGELFDEIARAVASVGAAVVDGGTDAGVMSLMGEAAARAGSPFPLVGVAAEGTVWLPGELEQEGLARLERHHTHFVLVPGDEWGDESDWLAGVAAILAGVRPSVTLLVNGGQTSWRDVEVSVAAGRPVIVVNGTGRVADEISALLRGERRMVGGETLVASGLVEAVSIDAGAACASGAVLDKLEG